MSSLHHHNALPRLFPQQKCCLRNLPNGASIPKSNIIGSRTTPDIIFDIQHNHTIGDNALLPVNEIHFSMRTMERQLATGDAYTALLWSEKMLDSIPALKESKVFMDLHNKAIIDGSAWCYRNSYDGIECTERLSTIIQKDPEDKELAFKAGKLVRLNMHSATAVPFFIQALKGRSDPKKCADPDVLLAIKAGMGLSGKNAKGAQELGFSLCFNTLKIQLLEDFYNSNNYAVVNYCDSLSKKKMLTKFQKAYCSDQQ